MRRINGEKPYYRTMGNLFLSFSIAVGAAVGLVGLSRAFDVEFYTSRILPLVPILYAIVYEVLEHRKEGAETLPGQEGTQVSHPPAASAITAGKIVIDVAISFVIKFLLELFLVALYLRFGGQSFSDIYGPFGIETVGRFLRGEHPWLAGKDGLYLLALVALSTSYMTGLWIGNTAKGNATLEGVLAGAAVTLINSMTSMLVLYRTIEEMAVRLAESMGYILRAGFLVVLALQVLLYGLWSGLAQKAEGKRELRAALKKQAKRSKR